MRTKLVIIGLAVTSLTLGPALFVPVPHDSAYAAAQKKQKAKGKPKRTHEWCQAQIQASGGGTRGGRRQQERIANCMAGKSSY